MNLPEKVTFTSGDYLAYDYDAAGNKLSSSVYKAGALEKQQDYVGELHYVDGLLDFISHEEGRVVVKEGNPEYQYFLKDHLGNTRLTFTSRPDTDEYLATYETDKQEAEANTFQNYNEQDILSYEALNHTPVTGATKVLRLNNYRGDRYGTAKNIAVLPGDTVIAEVYVKYLDLRRSDGLNADAIIAALAGTSGYTVSTDAYGTTSITQDGTTNSALLGGPDADAAPTAFLNYYLYDRDRNNYNGGFVQVPIEAAITSPDNLSGGHEMLRIPVPITKAGYIHLEFSHDPDANGLAQDVDTYFDDFSVQHKHGPVIQAEDYYPFGLTHAGSSYTAGERNKYLYNGKELQDDLGLDMYDYGARMYDAAIGRWMAPDPLADRYYKFSPYVYVGNSPTIAIDPDGKRILFVNGYWMDNWIGRNIIGSSSSGKNYWRRGFTQAAQRFFNDYSSVSDVNYIDGSSSLGGDMSGSDREKAGYKYAKANYSSLVDGLGEDETFKLVTHSEGGAYGAGIARYLIEQGHNVETILHLSTDEADEFNNPENTTTYQLGYGGDWVTGNKEVSGADVFGVVDKFSDTSDKIKYAHGSTKGAGVFNDVKALLKAAASGATGVNVTETSSGVRFEFIRKKENENKEK